MWSVHVNKKGKHLRTEFSALQCCQAAAASRERTATRATLSSASLLSERTVADMRTLIAGG